MICDSAPGALLRNMSVPFYAYVVNVADDENTHTSAVGGKYKKTIPSVREGENKAPKTHTTLPGFREFG